MFSAAKELGTIKEKAALKGSFSTQNGKLRVLRRRFKKP